MSTRSAICIYVQTNDHNKLLSPKKINLPPVVATRQTPYLSCYCHFDGYPSGVGQDLINGFNSYESALELVLQGSKEDVNLPWGQDKKTAKQTDCRCVNTSTHPIKTNFSSCLGFWPEYIYVFGRDKKWRCYDVYEHKYVAMPTPNDEPLPNFSSQPTN